MKYKNKVMEHKTKRMGEHKLEETQRNKINKQMEVGGGTKQKHNSNKNKNNNNKQQISKQKKTHTHKYGKQTNERQL